MPYIICNELAYKNNHRKKKKINWSNQVKYFQKSDSNYSTLRFYGLLNIILKLGK